MREDEEVEGIPGRNYDLDFRHVELAAIVLEFNFL
jgi:hypothetical protein